MSRGRRFSALLFASVLVVVGASAQSTCLSGRVSLSTLPTTTYVFGASAYTVGFCNTGVPSATSLASCGQAGYVQEHFVSNGTCRDTYPTIITGLTEYVDGSETGAYFIVSADGSPGSIHANVTVVCDLAGSTTAAALVGVTDTFDGTSRMLHLRLSSYAGCAVSNLFCSDTIACADSSKTCVNGVCFDQSCAAMTTISSTSTANSAFSGQFSVADCHGTPLANLNAESFSVALNGVPTTNTIYAGEVPIAVQTAPQAMPAITTLLLDQSSSVTSTAQEFLKNAARTYVNTVQAANTNHYVAVIAFDGAAEPTVVLQHTNDNTAILNAINNSLPPSSLADPQSTNLYGAVISGVRAAHAMRFSFGAANATVVSSLIVFTDGYDTSARTTQAAAITEVNKFSSTVSVISIGVADTSDTAFLTSIATSGIYSFPSTTTLVSSFAEVATRVATTSNSVYSVALCVPLRSSAVAVTLSMNTSQGYTTSQVADFVLNASTFTGGCVQSTVDALAASGATNTSVNGLSTSPIELAYGESIMRTLDPAAAAFVTFTAPASPASVLTVTPNDLLGRYVTTSTCLLSPYCFDGTFNTSLSLTAGQQYRVMVENSPDATNEVTISFVAAAATTAAPATISVPTSPPVTPPVTTAAAFSSSSIVLVYNVSETTDGDVDAAAAYIFVVFAVGLVVTIVAACLLNSFFGGGGGSAKHIHQSRSYAAGQPSFTVAPHYSGGDSMAYARTPSTMNGTREMDASGLHHTLMMRDSVSQQYHPQHTPRGVTSGVSPYRGTPFGDQAYGRTFDASARWSPNQNLDDL